MTPIQLWLPILNVSWDIPSFKRDVERAQRNWLGEDRIWLLPGIKEIKRWSLHVGKTILYECAIPSETFNMITVVNVSKDGTMFPSDVDTIPENWNGKLPKNLFEIWINSGDPALIRTKNVFRMATPVYKKGKLFYALAEIPFSPGPSIPVILYEDTREVELTWPPKDSKIIESISPEAESKDLFGEYEWEDEPTPYKENIVVNKDSRKAIHTAILWNEPFWELFPFGGGIDLLNHRMLLKVCIKNLDKNRGLITTQANRFTSEGWTDLESQKVIPAIVRGTMQELLFNIEGSFDIQANNLEELINHKKYNEKFHVRIPVTRIFGWEGYFWWELNNFVNVENKSIKTCKRCGNIIHGKSDKEFCGPKESPDCYRERKRISRRKERKK